MGCLPSGSSPQQLSRLRHLVSSSLRPIVGRQSRGNDPQEDASVSGGCGYECGCENAPMRWKRRVPLQVAWPAHGQLTPLNTRTQRVGGYTWSCQATVGEFSLEVSEFVQPTIFVLERGFGMGCGGKSRLTQLFRAQHQLVPVNKTSRRKHLVGGSPTKQ